MDEFIKIISSIPAIIIVAVVNIVWAAINGYRAYHISQHSQRVNCVNSYISATSQYISNQMSDEIYNDYNKCRGSLKLYLDDSKKQKIDELDYAINNPTNNDEILKLFNEVCTIMGKTQYPKIK